MTSKIIPVGLSILTVGLLLLAGVFLVRQPGEHDWQKLPPPKVEVAKVEYTPSVEQALTAVARVHINAKKVCHDPEWGYFLDYGKPLGPGEKDDGIFHGTWLIQNVVFRKASNDTYWMDGIPHDKYISVSPTCLD